MSTSVDGLQSLVKIAHRYSKKWRFLFNPSKCSILQFGRTQKCIQVKIGENMIKNVRQDKHLGVVMTDKNDCVKSVMKEKIHQCKAISYSTQALGSHNAPITPKTYSKVHWSVCIPKLCYGSEVLDIDEDTMNTMETYHYEMAKHAQNLPKQCSNPGSIATLGWKGIRAHCNFLKLIFVWQLLSLSFECIFKKVCLKRLCLMLYTDVVRAGPLYNIMIVCKEYGLLDHVRYAIETGSYVTREVWKTLVKEMVHKLEVKRFVIQCQLYRSMHLLSDNTHMCTWWIHSYFDPTFAKKNRTLVRMLLNVDMYREHICQCCDLNVLNNVTHILFVCPCINEVRERCLMDVRVNLPENLVNDFEHMTLNEKTRFMLNACNSRYISDWKNMFDAVAKFIHSVYTRYMLNIENCA